MADTAFHHVDRCSIFKQQHFFSQGDIMTLVMIAWGKTKTGCETLAEKL